MENIKDILVPGPEGSEERDQLDYNVLRQHQENLLSHISTTIEDLRDTIEVCARKSCDQFWVANHNARELGSKEDQGYFGTRVRRRGRSVTLEWYHNRFWQTEGSPRKRIASTYISKSYTYHHDLRQFQSAPEWERFIIGVTEDRYKNLRQQIAQLKSINQSLEALERLQTKFIEL